LQSGAKGCQSFAQDCSGSDDSGSVIYSVIDFSTFGDSIWWSIKVIRTLQVHAFDQTRNYDSTYSIHDSSTFILYEKLTNNHQLVAETVNKTINPIWIFLREHNINRYQETDSTGSALLSFSISGIPTVNATIEFHADTGLVNNKTSGASILLNSYLIATLSKSILTTVGESQYSQKPPNAPVLENIFPNPFNSSSVISFSIPISDEVIVRAYNILGERVATITNGYYSAGVYNISWSPNNLPSGIYFIKMNYKKYIELRKCLILK